MIRPHYFCRNNLRGIYRMALVHVKYVSPLSTNASEKSGSIKGVLKGSKRISEVEQAISSAKKLNAANEQAAVEITRTGAIANTFLAGCKGVTGYIIGSTALIADAINSVSDLLCDAVVYLSVVEARKAATPDRPWGRGKLEPLGSLVVSGLLMATGLGIASSATLVSIQMLVAELSIEHSWIMETLHFLSLSGAVTDSIPHGVNLSKSESFATGVALGVSSLSIMMKELLFQETLKIGEKSKSASVVANAWQHRSDAAISAAVFAGLIFSFMGYPFMDPIMAVVVSGVVVKQAYITGRDSFKDLSDAPTTKEETLRLKETCLGVPGILSVHTILARRSGPYIFVECTVGVKGMISASAAHRIAELVRMALLQKHAGRVANAVVHVLPIGSAGMGDAHPNADRDHDQISKEVTDAVLSLSDIKSVSEIQVYYKDDGRIAVKVDVVMNPDLTIRAAHGLAVKARQAVENAYPHIASVDVDLELDDEPTPTNTTVL